jgi:thiol-disulfide isomerase/thioredoxin
MTRYRNTLLAGISFIAVSFGLPRGLFAQSPAPVSVSALKATTDAGAESNDKEVLRSVEQIRDDVRALRHEVDMIRTLLESPRRKRGELIPSNGVYFFDADWCGPCRQMRPLVERLKREGLPIVDVNSDQRVDLRCDLHIAMLPTVVLMIGGNEKERATGLMDEGKLRALLAKIPNGPATSAKSKPVQAPTSNAKAGSTSEPSDDAAAYQADTAPHDSPRGAQGAASKTAEYELRAYSVADLVVPLPGKSQGGNVNENFEKLMGLMTGTIEPSSWQNAGGKGQILQSDKTLSLIVRQSPAIHRQILILLQGLRALQNWQVCLDLALVQNAPGGLLERVGPTRRLPGNTSVLSLSDEQRTALVASARQNHGTDVFVAKVTMFPGTHASVGAARNGTGGETIDIETVDSTDRYAVRLRFGVHDNKTGKMTTEPVTVTVPNLKPVVIELKRTSMGSSTKPTLLVVRPRFLFPIEEEEQQETPHHSELQPFEAVPITE